jgi:hypothetical protein
MDIILLFMAGCIALVLGFGLVMAIDLNNLINANIAAEEAARGNHEKT